MQSVRHLGKLVGRVIIGSVAVWLLADVVAAQPPTDSGATTESSCNFGMEKGERLQSCTIPVPAGCVVANFPGSTKPWTSMSKGGATTCRFDESRSDWKTKVTGTCGRCKSGHCSARFAVMLDCSKK
jgi:hypothetical protein